MAQKLLSDEEFRTLFFLYEHDDRKALAEIVAANQGMISCIADRHATYLHSGGFGGGLISTIDWEDLVQSGNVGLLEALKRFDPKREVKFDTFAYSWIDKHIRLFINSCLLVKTMRSQFRDVMAMSDLKTRPAQRGPKAKEDQLDIVDVVRQMTRLFPGRNQNILRLRFGLEDGIEHQEAALAERFGLNRQAINKVVHNCLAELKIVYERYQKTGKITPNKITKSQP